MKTIFLSTLCEFLNVPKSVPDPSIRRQCYRYGDPVYEWKTWFSLSGYDRPVLHDIVMTIRPGEIVALVGRNGSVKTTLTKLLCRLYDPDIGQISIDGIDLRDFRIKDLPPPKSGHLSGFRSLPYDGARKYHAGSSRCRSR